MSSASNDQIRIIVDQFELAWSSQDRPWIADYFDQVPASNRENLLAQLIPIDLDFRRKQGERPKANDYLQLGPAAVDIADRDIHDSFASFDTSKDLGVTAVEPSEPQLDESDKDRTEAMAASEWDSAEMEVPSGKIGRYKLLQCLGSGGMGTVWMAEQEHPVRRRVALKVVRAELDSKEANARFESERQAVAMMDHQNIAKILDAGTTETGCPYFVMELVKGIPLNKYCDNNRFSIRERLELMVPVCRAIQHAHQKGIIHRDLKHSNVLVTQYDGKPVPKVIDFGLAKPLEHQPRLTDKTMFTEYGKVVGTLHYMSPEQASMGGIDIDTRSDIYSLGVMIYKLLTGTTPLQEETVSRFSVMQILEHIREKEPPRPSARLSSMGDRLSETSHRRQAQPEKLGQNLKGDLDWIVMKAMEIDRNRRYETANGLALDIERYLRNEEVRARPPSATYRIQKFVKRNLGLVASLAVISGLLVAGIVGTSGGMIWALNERDRANAKSVEARDEAINALQAEQQARKSEMRRRGLQAKAEAQLYAIRIKSAWSDWKLGNIESAWQMMKDIAESDPGWENRFLHTEFGSSETVLHGHAGNVVSLALSGDGRFAATAGSDNTVRVWNAQTKKLMFRKKLIGVATCVRFSRDSQWLACADRSNRISIWNLRSRKLKRVFGPYEQDITSIAFSPDGTALVAGSDENDSYREGANRKLRNKAPPVVRVIAIDDAAVTAELKGHGKTVTAVCYTPDGKTIASASLDGSIRIWKTNDDREFRHWRTLSNHSMGVTGLAVSPSGKTLASCSQDMTIRLWNLDDGKPLRMLVGHRAAVNSVAFSVDESRIVSASADRTARVWSQAGEELLTLQGHYDTLNDAAFSVDGLEVLTASDDRTARVWNARNKPSTVTVRGHQDTVWAADFSPDGATVVSASEDGTVAMIDVQSGEVVGPKLEHEEAVLSVAWAPNSPVVATGSADSRLRIWNADTAALIKTVDAHDDFIWDVDFSPDGKLLATASTDKTVKIWNADDWSLVTQLVGHMGELASARFSHNGRMLVTASDDKTVKLWDAVTWKLLHSFTGHTNTVWKAVFSPAGDLIASSSYDGEIIVWDVNSRTQIRSIEAHPNQIAGLAISGDGTRIVSASDDRTIKIWDMKLGTELFVLRDTGDEPVVHVSFSRDGKRLVSGNSQGWVTIRSALDWDPDSQPFLPQEAIKFSIDGVLNVTSVDATEEDFRRELANAEKVCRYYPSYDALTIKGIAQYRLGQFAGAVESLVEAQRLEPIEYGEPDVRPYIEGFLAIAYLKSGQPDVALATRKLFDSKSKEKLWIDDEQILRLSAEIEQAFQDAAEN